MNSESRMKKKNDGEMYLYIYFKYHEVCSKAHLTKPAAAVHHAFE